MFQLDSYFLSQSHGKRCATSHATNKEARHRNFCDCTLDKNLPKAHLRDMAPPSITEDYYMILEVEKTALLQQITTSYRRLALKLHPDRNPSTKDDATEQFQRVC